MHNIPHFEAEGLQEQTTTLTSNPVTQEQETETAVDTGSLKLYSWRMEKYCLIVTYTAVCEKLFLIKWSAGIFHLYWQYCKYQNTFNGR